MEQSNLEIYFLTPFLPHHAFGNALGAQEVPDWGPRLKTAAASVGPHAPREVTSVVPRACPAMTMGSNLVNRGFCEYMPLLCVI